MNTTADRTRVAVRLIVATAVGALTFGFATFVAAAGPVAGPADPTCPPQGATVTGVLTAFHPSGQWGPVVPRGSDRCVG